MYRVPPAGPAWPAVGARLERGVRLHCCAPKDWPAHQQRAMVLEAEATSARDAATHAVPLPLTALSEATAALGGSGPKEGGSRCREPAGRAWLGGLDEAVGPQACAARCAARLLLAALPRCGCSAHGDSRTSCWSTARLALCCLTFELSGRQRQDARPGLAKMYRVPPDRAWWPAVGPRLER